MKQKTGIPINQEEISHYLKDIRKLKVMTPERERELAERILSGFITEEEKKERLIMVCGRGTPKVTLTHTHILIG
jgi:DNA-directed RNA polymerase sigma subunit (sigma70/sigma32)